MRAPAHTALSVQQLFIKNGMTPMPYLPYSSNLTLNNFYFVFPWMKSVIKGKCLVEDVKQKMAEALKGVKIDEFKSCFEQWKNISIYILHQMESALKVTEV